MLCSVATEACIFYFDNSHEDSLRISIVPHLSVLDVAGESP